MHSGSSTLSVVAAEASEWDRHQRRAAETQTGSFHPIIVNADETRRLGVCKVAPLIVDRQFSSGWGGAPAHGIWARPVFHPRFQASFFRWRLITQFEDYVRV